MRFLFTVFILGSFLTACSGNSNPSGLPSAPQVPQKGGAVRPHKRLYFSYKNCDFDKTAFAGWNKTSTFPTTPPTTLDPEIAWKYLEVTMSTGPVPVFTTLVLNPFLEAFGESENFAIYRCKATFFVDVPSHIDVNSVDTVAINAFAFEQTFSIPVDLAQPESATLAASEIMTAEKALANTPHRVMKFFGESAPEQAWDMVILADGYTAEEMNLQSEETLRASKLGKQIQATLDQMFLYKPFDELKQSINVWLVAAPSKESGADIPYQNIVKDTFYESSLSANCIGRAPTVKRGLLALEMASLVPFDQILMLMNTEEHGGSGGTFAISTTGPDFMNTVIHELGHSVGRLADFYYYFPDKQVGGEECVDILHEEFVVSQNLPAGGNNLSDDDSKIAPNLTVNAGAAKWAGLLSVNLAPVYTAHSMDAAEVTGSTVKFKVNFTPEFQKLIFLPGYYPGANRALVAFSKILIDGVEVPADKISKVEAPSKFFSAATPSAPVPYIFNVLDVPLTVGKEVLVEIQYPENYKDWLPFVVFDAANLKFVSYVFDPTEIGLFQGANPSLDLVFRSSYVSMMMVSGIPFDRVEEQAMRHAISQFSVAEEVPAR